MLWKEPYQAIVFVRPLSGAALTGEREVRCTSFSNGPGASHEKGRNWNIVLHFQLVTWQGLAGIAKDFVIIGTRTCIGTLTRTCRNCKVPLQRIYTNVWKLYHDRDCMPSLDMNAFLYCEDLFAPLHTWQGLFAVGAKDGKRSDHIKRSSNPFKTGLMFVWALSSRLIYEELEEPQKVAVP